MHTTKLHKVGGSIMLAVPPALLDILSIIRCDQPRALDLSARGGKKLERAPDPIVDEVLAKLTPIFE